MKGRLKFTDLNEAENINYVKYNIPNSLDLLQMFDSAKPVLTPKIVSAML